MTLKEEIEQAVTAINPQLEELAEGYVELMDMDEAARVVTLKSFGGRLH